MEVRPHDRFSKSYQLNPELVAQQALVVGDTNPVHHDVEFAKNTRFNRPIASGTHTTALLLALTASHFSQDSAMLGLDYWVGFKRPIYADEKIDLQWLVIRVTPNAKLGGDIVELRGRILGEDGKTSLGAKGRLLVTNTL
ncbi:MAG: MaoC family dehydratase [Pseudomonadales bacterium]|nr:MaoC family dehydratase [Pseudomonadales bacterium]